MAIYQLKSTFQSFLADQRFSYAITLEPNECHRFTRDEVQQRLRQIEFQLNKKYLKGSFPRWKLADRFWFVASSEGDVKAGTDHFHILLHVPAETYQRSLTWFHRVFAADFRFMWWSLCPPETRPKPNRLFDNKPIWIEAIYDDKANSIYLTKKMPLSLDSDGVFFVSTGRVPVGGVADG